MDDVIAKVDGKIYKGWTAVTISRALKASAGEIRLTLTSPWHSPQSLPLLRGKPIIIDIGNERVATGYISEFIPSYDSKEIRYELICFDKTVDLAECAVEHPSGQWKNITLTSLAELLCIPFSIDVVVDTDVGAAFQTVRLEQGETVFELLERLSRQRGVLLTSNALGNLVITSASTQRLKTTLALGVNIIAARGRFSERERFNKVIVKGAAESWVSDDPSATGGQSVVERDDDIHRYRPLIILMEENFTVEGASRRGKWQISRALAAANSTEVTVLGWRMNADFTGELWPLNKQVKVVDPIQGLNDYLLISGISLSENEGDGRSAVLTLVPPEAMKITVTETPEATTSGWKT